MADKSPRKQASVKKLSTKEKQSRKRAKNEAKALAASPVPHTPKPGGRK